MYGEKKDVNYTTDEIEALDNLFTIQKETQDFVSKKRDSILSPYDNNIIKRINAAIYYWNATTVEYAEMRQGMKDNNWPNVHEELVDMLHFILASFIYLGLDSFGNWPLASLFQSFNSRGRQKYDVVIEKWSNISINWGLLIDSLPYKSWKSYPTDELRLIHTEEQIDLSEKLFASFCEMCDYLGLDENTLYQGYINKNKENIARQQKGGIYER